jgi:hypothetical protein
MRSLVFGLAIGLTILGPAGAADISPYETSPPITDPAGFEARWQVGGAAYLWAPSLKGTVGIGELPPVDVDASFLDLLENLDIAFMAVGEVRYDRFGIFTDIMYTKLTVDGTGPLGLLSASVTNQLIVGTLMAEYRVIEQGKSSVDLMAGARLWGVTGDFEVNANVGAPPAGTTGSDEKFWVDPMIGVKSRLQGASPWYLTGWAMIGGFGVSSEIDWDLFGGVGYEVNDRFSVFAGYRGAGVDYEDGDFKFDIIQYGPVMGGVFRF